MATTVSLSISSDYPTMATGGGGGHSPLSSQPNLSKMVDDVIDCALDLKNEFATTQAPITDDSPTLQRFCAKLEYLLQAEQRGRSSFLSGKKDYWNYFGECLTDNKGLNDGIRYVKKLNELKTPLGFGRAFLRFALLHQRLADSLQACVIKTKITSDWYTRKSVWLQPALYGALINSLYDLNSVHFDLAPQGYDLDAAWPTFAKKSFNSPSSSWGLSRSSSVASLSSLNTPEAPNLPTLKLDSSIAESIQSTFVGGNTDANASWTEEELAAQNQIVDLQNQVDSLKAQISDQQASTEELLKSYQRRCEELEEKSSLVESENSTLKSELQDLEFKFIAQKQHLHKESEQSKRLYERVRNLEAQNSEILSNAEKLLTERSESLDSKSNDVSQAELLLTRLTESETRVGELVSIEGRLISDVEKIGSKYDKLENGLRSAVSIEEDCDVDSLLEKIVRKLTEFDEEKETLKNAEELVRTRCVFLESENDKLSLEVQNFERQFVLKNENLESLETDNQLMKNEVLKLSKELEKVERRHESELSQSLSSSLALNQEIRLEMEELKFELQRREDSVEREKEEYTNRIDDLRKELDFFHSLEERSENDVVLNRQTSRVTVEKSVANHNSKEDENVSVDSGSELLPVEPETRRIGPEVNAGKPEVVETDERPEVEAEEAEGDSYETCELDSDQENSVEVIDEACRRESRVLELTESTEVLLSEKINQAVEQEAEGALTRLRHELARYVNECESLRSLVHVVTDEETDPEILAEIGISIEHTLLERSENYLDERRQRSATFREQEALVTELKCQARALKQRLDSEAEEHSDQMLQISRLKTQVCVLQNSEVQLNFKLDDQKELCDELSSKVKELEAKLVSKAEVEKVVPLESEKEDEIPPPDIHVRDIDTLRVEINHQIDQIENLRKMIEQAEKELRDREFRISSLDLTNQKLADEMRLLQDLVSTANESSQRFETQIKSFEERITIMTRSFHGLQEENQRLLAEKTRLISDNGTLRQQLGAETEHRKALEQEQDLFEKSMVTAFEEKSQILNEELKRSRLKINRMFDPELDLDALIADDLALREVSKDDRCEYSSDDDDVTSGSYDVMSAGAGIAASGNAETSRKKARTVRVSRPGDSSSRGEQNVTLVKTTRKDDVTKKDLLKEETKCDGCKKRNKVIEKLEKKNENQVEILSDLEDRLTEKCRECDQLNYEVAELILERSCQAGKMDALSEDVESLCAVNETLKNEMSANQRRVDDDDGRHGNGEEVVPTDGSHGYEEGDVAGKKNRDVRMNGVEESDKTISLETTTTTTATIEDTDTVVATPECTQSNETQKESVGKEESEDTESKEKTENTEGPAETEEKTEKMENDGTQKKTEDAEKLGRTKNTGEETEPKENTEASERDEKTDDAELRENESQDAVPNLLDESKRNFYLNFPKSASTNELRSPLTPDLGTSEKRDVSELSVEELVEEKRRLEHKLVELTLELDRHEADCAEMERYITDITNRFKQNKTELEDHIQQLEEKRKQEKNQYDNALKCYASQGFDLAKLTDRMAEQEGIIQSLEIELQAIRDERQIEKERQWVELNDIKTALMQREEDCCLLSDQLKKTTSAYDEERGNLIRIKRQLTSEKNKYDELFKKKEKELTTYITDSVELKKKLIKLIKEKDSLWKKTDKLEYQQRVKAAETWMNDADVTHCLGCRQEFSFMLRKHHCRLCGRIFCSMCSNNWVLTTHSKTKSRVCNLCFIERESGTPSPGPGNGEDLEEDASIQIPRIRSTTWSTGGTESLDSTNISETLSPLSRSSLVSPVSSLNYSLQSSPSPSPDGQFLSGLPQNATDEVKTIRLRVSQDSSDDFASTTDELTGAVRPDLPRSQALRVSVDGDEVAGDRDEIFHLISDEEIARSLTSSEPMRSAEESLTRSLMLSTSQLTSQTDDVSIESGKMFAVPVFVEAEGVCLCWQFSTEPKSILFSLTYRRGVADDQEEGGEGEEETLVPPCHCNSHRQRVRGELTAQQTGYYTLYFDNTAARNTDKKLNYVIEVKSTPEP